MKTLKDPLVSFIENESDVPDIISSYFPDWMDIGQNVLCPFHDDSKTRSLHIDPSGKGYCHGCGHKFKDVVDLVAQMEGWDYQRTKHELYADLIHAIPESEVGVYVTLLNRLNSKKAQDWLTMERNISLQVQAKYKIGYEPKSKRLTIPIYDQFDCCVNIRRMGWLKSHRCKALNVKGRGEVRLFPEKDLILERRILLVEGEFDMLCARSFGLPAVTWTGGASNWNEKYENMFRGKAVWICYDNDKAGEEGMVHAYQKLLEIAESVVGVCHSKQTKGKDITDWSFTRPKFLKDLRGKIEIYKFPVRVGKKKICPRCGQIIKEVKR